MAKTIQQLKFYKGVLFAKILKFFAKVFGFNLPPIVSTCAIITNKSKILAIKLNYLNGLALPGGMLNGTETFEKALDREIYEETNLKVLSKNFFGSYNAKTDLYFVTTVCFIAKTSGKIKSSDEGEAIWISPRKFIKNAAYKDNIAAIKDYINYTKFK